MSRTPTGEGLLMVSLVMSLLLTVACQASESPARVRSDSAHGRISPSVSGRGGIVVARVGSVPIHAAQIAREMQRVHTNATRALDNLVTFEVLVQAAAEARTELAESDGEAIQSIRVQRLLEREIEPRLAPNAVPEADVRTLYERNRKRFVHGRLVEIAVLSIFTGARMKPQPRARAEESARLLKSFLDSRAAAGEDREKVFDAIAKDQVWVDRKVSLTTVWQDEDEPFPAVVGHAVKVLSKPGDMTDLVGDETGYYIACYLSERPSEDVPFSAAAPQIRKEMYEPWRRQQFLKLSTAYADGHDVQVFPENFPLLAAGSPTP